MKKLISFFGLLFTISVACAQTPQDFTKTDVYSGNIYNLFAHLDSGGVVLLNIFATIIPACQTSESSLEQIYQDYKSITNRVQVWGLDGDNSEDSLTIRSYMNNYGSTYPHFMQCFTEAQLYLADSGDGTPHFVVLGGPQNQIFYENTWGWSSILDTILRNAIDSALNVINGIDNEFRNNKVSINISPNPFTSSATLRVTGDKGQGTREFTMYDLLGREVYHSAIRSPNSTITRGNLPAGMYLYKVTEGDAYGMTDKIIATGKIIIQ